MNSLTSWQKVLLVCLSMTLVVICKLSKTCGENTEAITALAFAVVGGVLGLTNAGGSGHGPPKA